MGTMKPVLILISIIYSVTRLTVLNERIAGGDVATVEQFPYVISIIENERHFCGGFIYNYRWINTAAFCVDSVDFVKYDEVNADDLTGNVVGWGAIAENEEQSTKLRYGTVDIKEKAQCGDYSQLEFKLASMICASGAIADPPVHSAGSPCQFDQGSPLVQIVGTTHIPMGVMSKTRS